VIAHVGVVLWLMLLWACVGAVAWEATHALAGGAWGHALAPAWRRQRRWLPVAMLLAAALLIGASHVFPWLVRPVEPSRQWYLNLPALVLRTIVCLGAFGVGGALVRRTPALVLVLWLFATGIVANDWIVSLAPDWRSSAIGLIAAVGQLSVALALAVATMETTSVTPATRSDAGSLLIAVSLGWAYLAGVDYLTAWMGDLPYETGWYLPRTRGPWAWLAVGAVALHLVVPAALLLPRHGREGRLSLRAAAVSVLAGEACHIAWMVVP